MIDHPASVPHDGVLMGLVKLTIAWVTVLYGVVTIQNVALFLASIFSALQIYILLRDKIFSRKP